MSVAPGQVHTHNGWSEMSAVPTPRECGLWLSLGGFHERGPDWEQSRKIFNCHVLLDSQGETWCLAPSWGREALSCPP